MEFTISKMRDGGFIVDNNDLEPVLATTTYQESLDYIAKQFAPEVVNNYEATPAMWEADHVGRLRLVEPDQFGGH
jgi:hypothetical protein